jgi:hypothetical protein
MTDERIAAIEAAHNADRKGPTLRTDSDGTPMCWACYQRWPCDTAIVLARLREVEQERDDLKGLLDLMRIRANGLEHGKALWHADADRLARALREIRHEYHSLGAVRDHWSDPQTGKIGDGPVPIDTCDDTLCVDARAALAAHEATK